MRVFHTSPIDLEKHPQFKCAILNRLGNSEWFNSGTLNERSVRVTICLISSRLIMGMLYERVSQYCWLTIIQFLVSVCAE
jgi:hypothetical protein